MRKLTVEEYDRLSPVKKHYYCKALEREKNCPRLEDIAVYPCKNMFSGGYIWLTKPRLEAVTAFYSALVKEREELKQRLEAEFGGES